MDWYLFLTPLLLLPVIFLFRLVGCTQDFEQFEPHGGNGGATTYNFEGPTGGERGVESTAFTVSLIGEDSVSGDLKVTPDDDGDGGTFEPEFVVLNNSTRSATFTYTPLSGGNKNISTKNDGGLTDPPSLTYEVPITISFKLIIEDQIPSIQPNPILYIWPRFRIDDDGSGPSIQYASDPNLNPPVTFESVPTQLPAGQHTCSCDLFMLRLGLDGITPDNAGQAENSVNANPDYQAGRHLTGPATVDPGTEFVADTVITFHLHYTQSDPNATDYNLSDFSLEPSPL